MTGTPLSRILALATPTVASGFLIESCPGCADALERLAGDEAFDAVMVDGDNVACSGDEIAAIAERAALVIVVVEPDAEHAAGWLRQGADDVVGRDELAVASGWRRVRYAIERRRRALRRRTAYSTDPVTGLPHRQQFVEHLSQLLALREREPAPMAVLAFRIEGLGAGSAPAAEADILRRKIAVRLRAGVRASDVVAAIDDESFALLLGSIVAPTDGDRVAAKLVASADHSVPRRRCRAIDCRRLRHRPLPGRRPGRGPAAAPRPGARGSGTGHGGRRAGDSAQRRGRAARRRQRPALAAPLQGATPRRYSARAASAVSVKSVNRPSRPRA